MAPSSTLTLTFAPGLDDERGHKELRDGLSTILQVGPTIWVANDESASIERLQLAGGEAGSHVQFALGDFLDLPAGDDEEIDIEGMDCADGYLWVVGSHSAKRCKPRKGDDPAQAVKRMGRTEIEANRYLLARIPMVTDAGLPTLAVQAEGRRAQRLRADDEGNELTRLLCKDKHLAPFMGLPGKENGFDVEGLAIAGDRLFLGLRGPVLRGWATVVELRPVDDGKRLRLGKLDADKGGRVRKHFLQLGGLGVRDLCRHGSDLLILAGPTMSLDGPVRVFRWRDAVHNEASCVVPAEKLEKVLEVPFGEGCDHAEGITLFTADPNRPPALLVVHDNPAPSRQVGSSSLVADVFDLPAS